MRSRTIIAILCVTGLFAGIASIAVRAYSLSGYKWAITPVIYYLNPTNQDVSTSAAEAAVQAGVSAWNGSTSFKYIYGGRVSDTKTTVDGRNVIMFRNTTSGSAVASTYSWASGGVRIDADIVFWDGAYKFFTGTSGCSGINPYIEDIATHESGHGLGLQHSGVQDATMYSTYSACTTWMRTPASDDVSGLKALYSSLINPVTNTAPTVSITRPTSGSSYAQGSSVAFSGTATDSQDGSLTGAVTWTSNLDGQIGNGGSFNKVLSVGTHTITARVTDSGGLPASRQTTVTVTSSTGSSLPSGWSSRDVGAVSAAGSSTYSNGVFTVKGSGANIGGSADEFRFVYRSLTGNGTIVARVASLTASDSRAKAGVMMRESLTGGSKFASMLITKAGNYGFIRRVSTGANSSTSSFKGVAPYWVKLVRSGSTFTAYTSTTGTSWAVAGSQSITMPSTIYVGLAVTSRLDGSLATATLDRVAP